jgi:hypothetical protein
VKTYNFLKASLALSLFAAACSKDATTAPAATGLAAPTVSADLNAVTAANVTDQVVTIFGGGQLGLQQLPGVSASVASSFTPMNGVGAVPTALQCTYEQATGFYVCVSRKEGFFQVVRKFRLFSAGQPIAPGSVTLPDSTQAIWQTSGRDTSVDGGVTRIRAAARADSNMSVPTRDSTKAVLKFTNNGRGAHSDTTYSRDSTGVRTYISTGNVVTLNMIRLAPELANPFPASGTMTFTETIQMSFVGPNDTNRSSSSKSRTVVVTFNGTSTPSVSLDGKTCDLNLLARTISNCK